jgi:hypothetical protein
MALLKVQGTLSKVSHGQRYIKSQLGGWGGVGNVNERRSKDGTKAVLQRENVSFFAMLRNFRFPAARREGKDQSSNTLSTTAAMAERKEWGEWGRGCGACQN